VPDRAKGVFETLLVIDGRPLELDAHLARIAASTNELYGAGVPADARELMLERSASLALGRVRLTLVPLANGELSVDVVTAAVDPENVFPAWERGIELVTFAAGDGVGAHKWADRTALAELESSVGPGALPLLVDHDGGVLEGSRANVFVLDQDALLTPPADGRILPGVARACVLARARALGIETREEPLTLAQLSAAGEVFMTGSVRGIEPARSLDGAPLRAPGEVQGALAAQLRRAWLEATPRPAASRASA